MLNINNSFGNSFNTNNQTRYIKNTEFTEYYKVTKVFENKEV